MTQGREVIVLDTDVVVSGLLRTDSPLARVLAMVVGGVAGLAIDSRILGEYEEVLLRPKFSFRPMLVKVLLDAFVDTGVAVAAPPLEGALPDPSGMKFLEVAAIFSPPLPVVTGNVRHFPHSVAGEVPVMTPAAWLGRLRT